MRNKALLALLLFVLLLSPVLPVHAQAEGPVYVVQAGDTLSSIAQRFGTTLDALIAANAIADPSLLQPGDTLVIPGFEMISGVLTTREVEFGETLDTLSIAYGVERDSLMRLNRIIHPQRLYIGQAIIYPASEEPVNDKVVYLVQPYSTRLEIAAQAGANPWALESLGANASAEWLVPGQRVAAAGPSDLNLALTVPIQGVDVSPERAIQGRTVRVMLPAQSPLEIDGRLGEWELSFHVHGESWVALQGVHAMTEPGLYDLQLSIKDPLSGEVLFAVTQPMRITSGDYGFDPILFVPEETIDPMKTEPEDAMLASLVATATEDKLWDDTFLYPSPYTDAFPSVFGSRRNYNNAGYSSYHTGLDFYGATGTPITAPADGVVVFAGPLDVRGKVTVLDHGWGVYTGYYHQSEILVSEGDQVAAGDEIGLVGATGRVTGPHLHFQVWVGGVPVDPLEWLTNTFP